ncbi:protein of unknown function [Chryseobacterium sp. JV274]|nr:protein of unknown function [Chryseobacterium sp. JV274]
MNLQMLFFIMFSLEIIYCSQVNTCGLKFVYADTNLFFKEIKISSLENIFTYSPKILYL